MTMAIDSIRRWLCPGSSWETCGWLLSALDYALGKIEAVKEASRLKLESMLLFMGSRSLRHSLCLSTPNSGGCEPRSQFPDSTDMCVTCHLPQETPQAAR